MAVPSLSARVAGWCFGRWLGLLTAACQPVHPVTPVPAAALALTRTAQATPTVVDPTQVFKVPLTQLQQDVPGDAFLDLGANQFLALFPELRSAPRPAWLREGSRVTYYYQLAASSFKSPDEDDDDPSDDKPGVGGNGYMQYDLVALDRRYAVSAFKLWSLSTVGDDVTPSLVVASSGRPGLGDYWMSPDVLAHAEEAEGMVVERRTTEAAGTTYHAVRFSWHDPGVSYVWMFDEESGLLLFYGYEILDEVNDTLQSGQMIFADQRYLDLPWSGGTAPAWVAETRTLPYAGSYAVYTYGPAPTTLEYGAIVTLRRSRPKWAEYTLTDYVSGLRNTSITRVTGAAQLIGGFWLAPAALDALAGEPVRDVDPVTGVQLTTATGPGGVLVVTEEGALFRSKATYDGDSGVLLAAELTTRAGVATIAITLELAGND